MSLAESLSVAVSWGGEGEEEGEILPMIAHIGRLPLKVIPFPGFRHIKMQGFRELKYTKGQGNLSVMSCKRVFN